MIWGMTLHPGEEFTRKVLCDEHLTLASLECRAERSIDGGRPNSCLLLKTGGGEHVLCTLEEGVTNQQSLDLILEQGERITFLVEGTGIIYLTGYTSRKWQRQVSLSISDGEDGNTEFDDSFQGETVIVSEKDVSDGGDDAMNEVPGNHGDKGNHNNSDEDSGDDSQQEESEGTGDDHGNESVVQDHGGEHRVIEESGEKVVEGNAEFENSHVQKIDGVALYSDKRDMETVLQQQVRGKTRIKSDAKPRKTKRKTVPPRAAVANSSVEIVESSSGKTIGYKCFVCLERFENKADCDTHIDMCDKGAQWKRRDREPFRCKFCGKAFDKASEKRRHENIHTQEKPFECRFCKKKFQTQRTAKRHETIHTRAERLKCHLCPKTYQTKAHLTEHMRSHTGERPHQCHMCLVVFSTTSAYNRHMRRHETGFPHQCEMCGKGFSSKERLQSHSQLHTAEPKYKCRYCGTAFVKVYHRDRHEKLEHTS